jgi:hypothetical protein
MFFITISPPILVGYLVLKNSVNVPYWDDWDTPGLLIQKISQGGLTFQDWFHQANESRPIFPRLIFIILAYLTGWDLRYQMLLTFLLACLIAFNVFYLSQKTVDTNPIKLLFLNTLANLFIFTPVSENWLWGIQTITFIPIACMTTYAVIFYSNLSNITKLLIGMGLATISTFSYANGMLIWILALPVLFLSNGSPLSAWKKKKWFLGLWLAGFVANVSLYFYNYHKPAISSNFLEAVIHPFKAVGYFFAFLGSPLGIHSLILSQRIGFILVLLFVLVCVYLWKFRQDGSLVYRMTPWLVIASYNLSSGLMATAGRVGSGVEQALAPRYITFSVWLGVALIYLIAIVFQDAEARNFWTSKSKLIAKPIAYGLTLTFFYFSLNSFIYGANLMAIQRQERIYGKSCLLLINVFPEQACIQTTIYPHYFEYTKDRAKLFSELGFLTPKLVDSSIFQRLEKQGQKATNSYGELEQFTKLNLENYIIVGWAIIPERKKPADSVILTYEQSDDSVTPFAIVKINGLRPDIATAFHQSNYRYSGWQANFPSDKIPTQATQMTLWAFDTETGKAYKIESVPLEPRLDDKPKSMVGDSSVSPQPKKTLKDLGNIKIFLKDNAGFIGQVNDSAELEQTIAKNTPIKVGGWAILPRQNKVADWVILTVGDNDIIAAMTSVNIYRPDVAAYFKNPDLTKSGWTVQINPSVFTGDLMVLRAWAYDPINQEVYLLNNTFKLQMK